MPLWPPREKQRATIILFFIFELRSMYKSYVHKKHVNNILWYILKVACSYNCDQKGADINRVHTKGWLDIRGFIMAFYVQHFVQAVHVEVVQVPNVPTVDCPSAVDVAFCVRPVAQ